MKASLGNQDDLLKSQTELIRTQGEVVTDQLTEIDSKMEFVGVQTAEMFTFLQEQENVEAAKKKRAPPKKKTNPR